MNYALISRLDKKSYDISEIIRKRLNSEHWTENKENAKLIICVGGDGTLLYGVHQFLHRINDLYFIGIHTGTLGFFTDYTEDEVDIMIHDILHKTPDVFSSKLLKIQVDENSETYYALNEMRIENIIKSQDIDVYINGEFFEMSRGTGICLSTQAGSTAYNRGLRGAVIDNGLSVMQLAEITPIQHSKHRSLGSPYILKEDRIIRFKSNSFVTAMLCYDHLSVSLDQAQEITCSMSDKEVHFARYREYSYLRRLKNLY